jgi:hypothetical protein
MFNKAVYFLTFGFVIGNAFPAIAVEPNADFSATPDYSYEAYKSNNSYSSGSSSSAPSTYSSVRRTNTSSSTRTFSGDILVPKQRTTQNTYSVRTDANMQNDYSPQSSNSNPAYYRTNPYKY